MNLNPEQIKAVEHFGCPLLVLAGAGSGKTRVLVHRIAHLIKHHDIPPHKILAVTFTNKAAGEMRRRLENMVEMPINGLWVGTFHSVCLRMLRRYHEHLGYGPQFTIFDETDQKTLVRNCLRDLGMDEKKFPLHAVAEKINRAKDMCLTAKEYADSVNGNYYLERIAGIYTEYQKRMLTLQAMDFGDLIRLTVRLLADNPTILETLQQRWSYVLVDEYQDTNQAQYKLIEMLARSHKNLSVVGDPDQSIYRWRGANIENILRFEQDFPGAKVVLLEQNYRSTKNILAAAEAVISKNTSRQPKTLWTENEPGNKIDVISVMTEKQEAEVVAKHIKDALQRGYAYRDMAIFYRTNAQSRPFEDMFRRQGIPYQIFGGMRFYDRKEIKDIIAYLRLIRNIQDDHSFLRIINVPARGIGKETINRLSSVAQSSGQSLYNSITILVNSGECRSGTAKRLMDFHNLLREINEQQAQMSLVDLLNLVLDKSGYLAGLKNEQTIESEGRLENINELVTAVMEFKPEEGHLALSQFLDQIALVNEVDRFDEKLGAVTLMTLHLAKGLEFPKVFMVGVEENLFPHARSMDDAEELEEERRLCYVGMTRARRELAFSHTECRQIFGKTTYSVPSRFLADLPANMVVRCDYCVSSDLHVAANGEYQPSDHGYGYNQRKQAGQFRFGGSSSKNQPAGLVAGKGMTETRYVEDYDFDQRPPDEKRRPYAAGSIVCHPAYGSGVIKKSEPSMSGHKVTVRFNNGMVKCFIAEMANLKI